MKILLDLASAEHGTATVGGLRYRDLLDPARTVGVVLEPKAFHAVAVDPAARHPTGH